MGGYIWDWKGKDKYLQGEYNFPRAYFVYCYLTQSRLFLATLEFPQPLVVAASGSRMVAFIHFFPSVQ